MAGPSGNEQSKLPAPVVGVERVGADLGAAGAALGRVEREAVGARIGGGEAVGVAGALVDASPSPVKVTVGATLETVTTTTWLSVSAAPSESVTVAVTFVVAGPSAKKHWKLPSPVPAS